MARVRRIMVRLSLPMEVSLTHLAAERGQPESTVAFDLLRQALARTTGTAAVQNELARRRAQATRDEWLEMQRETAEEMREWQQSNPVATGS